MNNLKLLAMKFISTIYKIAFILGLTSSTISFLLFFRNIDKLGTTEEWKYYLSLAGFIIFFLMFLLLIITLIVKKILKKNIP